MSFECPLCEVILSWAAKLEKHIVSVHERVPKELYLEKNCNGVTPTCGCGCGTAIPWNGWKLGFSSKYLRGHNTTMFSTFSDPEIHRRAQLSRVANINAGLSSVWNKGLTVATDERLAIAAKKKSATLKEGYATRKYVPWQTGLTKETHESLAKSSRTHKEGYESGRIKNWTDGKTKETDVVIATSAGKISETRKTNYDSADRFSFDEVLQIISSAGFSPVTDLTEYRNKYQRLNVKCNTCLVVSKKNVMMLRSTPICFICHPHESVGQREISEFVASLGFDVIDCARAVIKPQEIDVFVPAKNFGIEYNGLYYHSERTKIIRFHENKTDVCIDKGVKLLHVFEDEWRDKYEIVTSMIRSRLGVTPEKVYARNCEVRELTTCDRRSFFSLAHIDGDVQATVAFGLYFKDRLVSAMSLRTPGKKYPDSYELARFASETNLSVVGGLGKLLAVAKRRAKDDGKKSLMTYVDKRHGDGHGYKSVGFQLLGTTKSVRYWWTGGKSFGCPGAKRVDRRAYKADSQREMSEREVAAEAGVVRINGCCNLILEMKL